MSEVYEILVQINANVEKAVQALGQVTTGMEKTEKQTSSLAHAFSVAAGVMIRDFVQGSMRAVINSLGTASDEFQEYELTLTRIVGATSATGDEAAKLSADLHKVTLEQAELGYSGREAAKALESLVKAGMDSAEAAEALEASLMLARLENIDTATAANYLVQTLTQFKLTAEDSAAVLNLISKAADAGIGTANDYAAGLSNTGAAAANLGVSLEETLAALVILDKTYGSATESGTFLNMMFKDMIAKSDLLGISLYNTDGSMKSLGEIIGQIKDKVAAFGDNQQAINEYLSVFDVRAQRAIIGLLNYDGSIEDVINTMGEARDVQEKFNMVMDTTTGQMASIDAALENASYSLGEMAAGAELAWKQFALGLGPIGAIVDAFGPTMLQGAMTGFMVLLPQLYPQLKKVFTGIVDLATAHQTLTLSIGAGIAAFTGIYGILMSLPDETRNLAAGIAVLVGSLVAATAAAIAFWTTISVGTLAPVIIAGVGAAVAGVTVLLSDAGVEADKMSSSFDGLGNSVEGLTKRLEEMKDRSAENMRSMLIDVVKHNSDVLQAQAHSFGQVRELQHQEVDELKAIKEASYEELLAMFEEYEAELLAKIQASQESQTDLNTEQLQQQLSEVESFYDDLAALEEGKYAKSQATLADYWLTKLEVTQTEQEKVLAEYNQHFDELEQEAKDSFDAQTAAAEDFFDQEISAATDSLNSLLGQYNLFYGEARTQTEIFCDDVLDYVNGFYDEQADNADEFHKAELDAVNDHYDTLLSDMKDAYQIELNETRIFYDEQIGIINAGLSEIRNLRSDELDQMELDYLKERALLKEQFESGILTETEYNKKIDELETAYRANRSAASEAWRLQELQYELDHKGELEQLETDKAAAIEGLEETHKGNMEALEAAKVAEIEQVERTHTQDLETIQTERNAAIASVMELLEPLLMAIQNRLGTSLTSANDTLTSDLAGIYSTRNTTLGNIDASFSSIATANQNALDQIEIDRTRARAGIIQGIWSSLLGNFKVYAFSMQGVINGVEADVNAAKKNIDQALAVFNAAMQTLSGATEASGYFPTGKQELFDYLKTVYNRGDYSTYSSGLTEARNRGYISQADYNSYVAQIPHGAEGGIVTEPTVMMVGEKGKEAIIPLEKAGFGSKFEILINVHDNVFSSEMDVASVFKVESDKLVRKLVNLNVGRIPD